MRLTGKSVVITGGSDGIGLATARAFAQKGARLALLARDAARLQQAAATLRRESPDAPDPMTVSCDVADADAVRKAFQKLHDAAGPVDVLINNAGVSAYGPAEETPLATARSVMEVDYFGAIHCILAALPAMRARGSGTIVGIASVAALHGIPYLSAYGSAKAALATYCQALRAELAGTGIDVLLVYPGYTQTDLFDKEERCGNVRRPAEPYEPAERVAAAVVRAVEKGRREVVLSRDGRRLVLAKRLLPGAVDRALARLARRLRGAGE